MLAVSDTMMQQSCVILGDVLLLCAGDGVVMLHDAHGLTEELKIFGVGFVGEDRQLFGNLQEVVA